MGINTQPEAVDQQPTTLADIDVHAVQEGLSSALNALKVFEGPVFEQVHAADECIDALVSLARHLDSRSTVDTDADADRARAISDDVGCHGVPEPKGPIKSIAALSSYVRWVLSGLFSRVAQLEHAHDAILDASQPVAEPVPVASLRAAPKRGKARKKAKTVKVKTDARATDALQAVLAAVDAAGDDGQALKVAIATGRAPSGKLKAGAAVAIDGMGTRERRRIAACIREVGRHSNARSSYGVAIAALDC
mgnify:CR=1 FL=1|tara:strand:+ start:462 stop:1211 length:750 start_codon:yes stop_codon:yes gene_type:complete